MSNLPQNLNYAPYLEGMDRVASQIRRSLPPVQSPKAVDVSKFSGVANSIKSGVANAIKNIGTVTTEFGGTTKYEKVHPGIDIANKIGTPLYAPVSGRVVESVTGKKQGDKGFGNYIMIVDKDGNKHRLSHLNDEFVKMGDTITQGQQYGTIGNSGQTYSLSGKGTGSHLDYRIRDAFGRVVNPNRFIS